MIEGLKITVSGAKLRQLCEDQSARHRERARVYREQIDNFSNVGSGEGPADNTASKLALREKVEMHLADAAQMSFISDHLKAHVEYLLDRNELSQLGIGRTSF